MVSIGHCVPVSSPVSSATAAGFSSATSLPSRRATIGVSATVGGKRMGESPLCVVYAIATVPTCTRRRRPSR